MSTLASKRLTVLHDDNSVFKEYSLEAYDFARETFSTTLVNAEDYLYIGLYKPFDRVYFEFSTANINANTINVEFYNGSTWTNVSGLVDYTIGFTKSGFLTWNRSQTDWDSTSVNSIDKYWIRIKPSSDHSATTYKGINILFSDDVAMKEEFFEINEFLPSGESSYILTHQGVRNEIVQKVRNYNIKRNSSGIKEQITEWDLLDGDEVKEAAKFMALEKIFRNISDAIDDKYAGLRDEFKLKAGEAINVLMLSLDLDDDGLTDNSEKLKLNVTRVTRV